MGAYLVKAVSKLTKSEVIPTSSYNTLWDIPVKDIDGTFYNRIGDLAPKCKALLIVNVASK